MLMWIKADLHYPEQKRSNELDHRNWLEVAMETGITCPLRLGTSDIHLLRLSTRGDQVRYFLLNGRANLHIQLSKVGDSYPSKCFPKHSNGPALPTASNRGCILYGYRKAFEHRNLAILRH